MVVYTLDERCGKYCVVTLKIMVILQNVCKNYVRKWEEDKRRQLLMCVSFFKNVKETGMLINKPTRERPPENIDIVRTPENIAAVAAIWT